jgi:hypothetical protein
VPQQIPYNDLSMHKHIFNLAQTDKLDRAASIRPLDSSFSYYI